MKKYFPKIGSSCTAFRISINLFRYFENFISFCIVVFSHLSSRVTGTVDMAEEAAVGALRAVVVVALTRAVVVAGAAVAAGRPS